jgi:hypothetical protein
MNNRIKAYARVQQLADCSSCHALNALRILFPCLPGSAALHSILTGSTANGSYCFIATAGPQSEVQLLPVFAELAMLLPQHQLDIHMIGPDVPEQLHARACTAANLHGEAQPM